MVKDKVKPDDDKVFSEDNEEIEASDVDEALRLLTLKKDDDNTLDLLTNMSDQNIAYLIKLRIFNDIFFKGEDMAQVIDNIDLNLRALLVSQGRKGREDIKEIKGYSMMQELMSGGMGDVVKEKSFTRRTLERIGINRD